MSTINWCRGCGFEDTVAHTKCPNCSSALHESSVEWLVDGSKGEEIVYELELTTEQRSGLVEALIEDEVTHRWDTVTELAVPESEEEAVDTIIDDVLHEEVEDVSEEELAEEEAGAAEGYEAMSQLFFASDKLLKNWDNDEYVAPFIDSSAAILMMDPPVGMEDEPWADIQSIARNASTALGQKLTGHENIDNAEDPTGLTQPVLDDASVVAEETDGETVQQQVETLRETLRPLL